MLDKKIEKRRFILLMLLSYMVAFICLFILNSQEHMQSDAGVSLSFAFITIICFINFIIAVIYHSFSLNLMFWLFNLFYFGIAPWLQFVSNKYAWNFKPSVKEISKTNLIILLWLLFYIIGHTKLKDSSTSPDFKFKKVIEINNNKLNFLFIVSLIITSYYIIFIGIQNLIFRSTNQNLELNKMGSLIINQGFHNFIFFSLLIFILKYKKDKIINIRLIVMVICFIISCFPTGLSRNMMGAFYLGIFLIVFDNKKNSIWMTFLIFLGLVLVFPAINIFRTTAAIESGSIWNAVSTSLTRNYTTGDYDAHQLFMSIQRWGKSDGLSYGKQLMGALFFFVPRTIWQNKPIGTGQNAFEVTKQHWYTNVSAPLISESWINFGVIGVIFFGFLLGLISRKIDEMYWKSNNDLDFIRLIFPPLLVMYFFIQRGDLQSTWSYTFSQIVVAFFVYKIGIKTTKNNPN